MARPLCCCGMCKICCDIPYNEVTLKSILHRIWFAMEKLFVKWAPLTHCGRPSLWHGSARPAFPGVAMWWLPLAARIWRAPPHGDQNLGSYTPRHILKYRTYLFVDITEISTVSILSSNENEAYIRCQLKLETLTCPDPHQLQNSGWPCLGSMSCDFEFKPRIHDGWVGYGIGVSSSALTPFSWGLNGLYGLHGPWCLLSHQGC